MWALEAHSEAQEEIQTKLSRRLAVMEANEGTAPSTLHDRSDGAEPSSEGHNSRLAEGSEEGEISETDERRPVAAGATGLLKNTPLDGGSQQQMRPPTLAQDELQKRRSLTPSVQAPTAQPGGRRHSSLPVAPGTHGELRDALISRPAPGLFDGTGLPPAVKANNMQLARIGSFGRLADKVKTEEPTIDTGNEASNKCATQIGRSQRELEAVARVSPFYQQHFTLEMAQVTFMVGQTWIHCLSRMLLTGVW